MKIAGLKVLIRGGGEQATAVAVRLARAYFKVCLTEIAEPQAVRRTVAFSEAVYQGSQTVEGITARLVLEPGQIAGTWAKGEIPLLVDPKAEVKHFLKPEVLVDAILAKRNIGTQLTDAYFVIGLGPGFSAGIDVHAIIETNRGHHLGRVIYNGQGEPNTGIPGEIDGITEERILRAPQAGRLGTHKNIGDLVKAGENVATVNGAAVIANVSGVCRGLLRDGTPVYLNMKIGDIDPRGKREYCFTISDKGRSIAGGVLEAVMHRFNQ